MAKTLLDAVNEILKRVSVNAGDAAALTTLTDSARQHNIDVSVQVVNEGIDELYNTSHVSLPKEEAESTIVLVQGQREYALAADLITLLWPLTDRTNTQYLLQWTLSYEELLAWDPNQNYTGLPNYAMISPITGQLRVDRAPDAANAGHTYYYEYDKDLVMSLSTDTVPFNNVVFRAMVPVWVQLYKREIRNEFDGELYKLNIGRACRALTELKPRTSYFPRQIGGMGWGWQPFVK